MRKVTLLLFVVMAAALALGQDQERLGENFKGFWKKGTTSVQLTKDAKKEVQLIIDYRGYVQLARR